MKLPATKPGTAALSIASNSLLIALKLAAGAITGSIAIITEAIHSGIDLIASVIAFISVRKSDEPADVSHPYGHEKVESLAATIEGILIMVGAGIIIFEATRRLVTGAEVELLWVGIAVMAFSMIANLIVSTVLYRKAREEESLALEGDAAHLRTDAATSGAVLVGLVLVELTGVVALDSITAILVAGVIVGAGINIIRRSSGVLVDEALPPDELDLIEAAIASSRTGDVAGYHKLRARRAGHLRHVDLHVQFAEGTSLERAHEVAHAMRDAIAVALPAAEVLIHVEPETSVLHPGDSPGPFRAG
jgi:cation diffusion facilitator family transporter